MEIIGVTQSVTQYLRDYIITGQLAPGQKLNELELSSRLNVSRPPLREAFRLLENERLVCSIPRKGCYVAEVSLEDCQQIFEAREMIECYALDLFKDKGIRNLPELESVLSETSDFSAVFSGNQKRIEYNPFPRFHIKLIESTGNGWVINFYKSITSSLARYQFMCTYFPDVAGQVQEEHELILKFIRKGHYDSAKEYLRSHIASMFSYIEQVLIEKMAASDVR